MIPPADNSMYLVLPVPFRIAGGKVLVEAQAANGLDRWADNFSRVTVAAPIIPEALVAGLSGFVWRELGSLQHRERIVVEALPWAYTPVPFFVKLVATRKLLGTGISSHQHLQFAIGGLVGDWASVAALEAMRQKRRYAVHTDRVEHALIRKTAAGPSAVRRARIAVEAPIMERYHRRIIRGCSLGLWHGDDCFRAYSPWCAQSHLIHDIHTKNTDLVDAATLARKVESVQTATTLEIVYAGRLDTMKDPLNWLAVIEFARHSGARIRATWYGEGALDEQAKAEATRLGLDDIVSFPGFIADRTSLLQRISSAHLLLFTHITPESPRILIEALVCGTPIIGYDPGYASDLIGACGGGVTSLVHDRSDLAHTLCQLDQNRERLAQLTTQAANNGRRFTDTAVFAERSELIKQFA